MSEAQSIAGPAEHHEKLKPFEGTFKAEVKLWMGPGDPMVSTGTMVNSWQLGGRYLHQDYAGDAVEGPYPSFCGKGYWGFNTTANHYEGFWIDNASTMMQMETGSVDDSGRVWTMNSTFTHPQTGQDMGKKTIITLVDNDHHTMESFFSTPDGNEMKTMEIRYQRS